ncbi:SRPBCC family protein [Halostagnicola kamekurae]|uniref:Polyketide cyclase / dehydrase and lipid transport n=1 Tax=Halostagnicola kamekurae TaxID=619731 RepID=A0A1I6SME7_9EURY|nr:SRPBCC family protein [Halostagnicola kamekurae]SFS77948.1 Polyketide cyclase / dehydrase and lipid transport [Halostagnicola kamekurae]
MTQLRTVATPDGLRLEASHVLEADPDAAWDLLVDTHRWPEWSPIVTDIEASHRRIEEGTTGRVRVRPGVWLPFTITSCDPAERRWAWNVARLPAAAHRVDALESNRCRIAFELRALESVNAPVCLRALERIDDRLSSETVVDSSDDASSAESDESAESNGSDESPTTDE